VVGQGLQHGEARGLLEVERIAFERNDLRGRVLLVDERAFEREIDEPGDDVARKCGICRSSSLLREAGCNTLSTS
jgi:hypothetical protein